MEPSRRSRGHGHRPQEPLSFGVSRRSCMSFPCCEDDQGAKLKAKQASQSCETWMGKGVGALSTSHHALTQKQAVLHS